MCHNPEDRRPSQLVAVLARILRIDPDHLDSNIKALVQNRGALLEASTWRDIMSNLPRRVTFSLILVSGLLFGVLFGSRLVSTRAAPQAIIDLPQPIRSALSVSQPTATSTPANLGSATSTAVGGLKTATPVPTLTSIFVFHTVEPDDTFISIAAKYNITAEELLIANNLRNPDDIVPGQYLLIPTGGELNRQKVLVHEISQGDTLLSIATRYGSSVKDIQAANPGLDNDEGLQPGQTVAIPIVFMQSNPVVASDTSEETTYYTVQSGDIPLLIAAQHDIPVEILLSANEIVDPTRLQVGQQLVIPPHDGISLGYPVVLYELLPSDTLLGIASRFGSSVKDILAVNPDLEPALIEPGQLVAIPVIFQPPKPTPDPAVPRPTPGPPPPGELGLEEQLVQAINAERVKNGLPPHTYDGQISEVALAHAQDMYVRDFFAHVSPDGATLRDRLTGSGVMFIRAGENIQRNTQPRDKTVQTAVNWFMNSPPHRANILHEAHNRIGVAVVEGPPGWFTFVINFAER